MVAVVITSTSASAQTWTVPDYLNAGNTIKVEAWGAGSGGSGSNTSNRAGGAGAAYASSPAYVITPNDKTNGISFMLDAGTAGTGAANSTAGTDTSWSTNNLNLIPITTQLGAVTGTPGTLPTCGIVGSPWGTSLSGLSFTILEVGIEPGGLPYIDVRFFGTVGGAVSMSVTMGQCVVAASTVYELSGSVQLIGGSVANTDFFYLSYNTYTGVPGTTTGYLASPIAVFITPSGTLTRWAGNVSSGVSAAVAEPLIGFNAVGAGAVDLSLRLAGFQFELGSSLTFYKSTPGFTRAKGGGATSGTTGGVGGAVANCVPTNAQYTGAVAFAGGSGATRAQGGGGGGAAGKDGAGASTTSATGGTADNGSGGAANTSNVEGGGGGTSGNPANAAGAPGGGGGGATSTNNGAAGGRGQIRLTYQDNRILTRIPTWGPILAQ